VDIERSAFQAFRSAGFCVSSLPLHCGNVDPRRAVIHSAELSVHHHGDLRSNEAENVPSLDEALGEIPAVLEKAREEYKGTEAWLRRWHSDARARGRITETNRVLAQLKLGVPSVPAHPLSPPFSKGTTCSRSHSSPWYPYDPFPFTPRRSWSTQHFSFGMRGYGLLYICTIPLLMLSPRLSSPFATTALIATYHTRCPTDYLQREPSIA